MFTVSKMLYKGVGYLPLMKVLVVLKRALNTMPAPRSRRIGYTLAEVINRMREISPSVNPII